LRISISLLSCPVHLLIALSIFSAGTPSCFAFMIAISRLEFLSGSPQTVATIAISFAWIA